MRKEKLEELNEYVELLKTKRKTLLEKTGNFINVEKYLISTSWFVARYLIASAQVGSSTPIASKSIPIDAAVSFVNACFAGDFV